MHALRCKSARKCLEVRDCFVHRCVLRMPGLVPGVQEMRLLVDLASSGQNVSGKDLNSSMLMD